MEYLHLSTSAYQHISTLTKMYLYNITLKIDERIHADWLHWMKTEYLPKMLSYQTFHEYKLYRILHIDDTDGPTYALQLFAESKALYNRFAELYEPEMQQMQQQRWGMQVLGFATLMEYVH